MEFDDTKICKVRAPNKSLKRKIILIKPIKFEKKEPILRKKRDLKRSEKSLISKRESCGLEKRFGTAQTCTDFLACFFP